MQGFHPPSRDIIGTPRRARSQPGIVSWNHSGRGVALVAVLAVLTIVAMMAMCFSVVILMEMEASKTIQGRIQSEMIAESGLQHALCLLRQDVIEQPAWDDPSEPWRTRFAAATADARHWIYVRNRAGQITGRYAVEIEDESGKININAATATSPDEQNQGVGTFEAMLGDGTGRGLPVSLDTARRIVAHRYGPDGRPGRANVDDNLTAGRYQKDEIDNNANGIVDEPGEGIDEPEEYTPHALRGDDRSFMSVNEMVEACQPGAKHGGPAMRQLNRLATVSSRSHDTFWDEREHGWQLRVNINVADRNQVLAVLTRANTDTPFEPSSRDVLQLAANIQDYRDQNHVLTTAGSEYGVESVCFNEILANDGSFTTRADFVNRFGSWYGNYQWTVASVSPAMGGSAVIDGEQVVCASSAIVSLMDDPVSGGAGYDDFKKVRNDMGGWLPDMWKNATLVVENGTEFPILGNTSRHVTAGVVSPADYGLLSGSNVRVTLKTRWEYCPGGMLCLYPYVTDCWMFPTAYRPGFKPPKDLYYAVYVAENNLPGTIGGGTTPYKGFNEVLDVDGTPHSYSETRMLEVTSADFVDSTFKLPQGLDRAWLLRTPYLSGKPVHARNGFVAVTVSSCRGCGYDGGENNVSKLSAYTHKNIFQDAHFMRPDILELVNISDKPICLRNWRVVINTGSYADQVSVIRSAMEYSDRLRAQYDNPTPVISPGGYFYLTNHRAVFDLDYGDTPDGEWGTTASEQYPCYELFQTLWGVRYKVIRIKNGNIIECENADWRTDQMKYEMSEWHLRTPRPDQNSPFGLMSVIFGNTRNSLVMEPGISIVSLKAGDDVLIVGLPRAGGFVSFTLKNEYGQITARTLEYGTVKETQFGYSTQKYDPTHYTWIVSPFPSIGGTEDRARNKFDIAGSTAKPHIKNSEYVSPAEMQQVRRAKDWENVGSGDRAATRRALQALCPYVTVTGIRLDAEEEGAHKAGWTPAFGTVASSDRLSLATREANWPSGIWRDQKLRMLSGPCAGTQFVINNSTMNSLLLYGPSSDDLFLSAQPGDLFSVGPGYDTALFYSRQDNEAGEWEWRNKDIEPGSYGLYLFGLNDSIITTEFLEENWNAEIEAAVYNFATHSYDPVPMDSAHEGTVYRARSRQLRYGKDDGVFCGMIGPEHLSPFRGIKLKLVPHSTGQAKCSGFAWFDYAYLAPGTTEGRININTAPAQVLAALKGITPALAGNIERGVPAEGGEGAKPCRTTADILNVQGITPEIYGGICNLITTRSDQFRVRIVGQSLADTDGSFDTGKGDKVLAESRLDVLLDRGGLTSGRNGQERFRVSAAW